MLDKLIKHLLYDHDCVVIPGLGAIIANRHEARIIQSQNIVLPPYKELSFNSAINKNDGLLASTLTRYSNLSYSQALQKINKEIEAWITSLENGDSIKIRDVGALSKQEDGRLLFSPFYRENYLADSYGLKEVELPSEKSVRVHEEPIENEEARKVVRLNQKEKLHEPRKLASSNKKEEKNKRILWPLYAAASILMAVFSISIFHSVLQNEELHAGFNPAEMDINYLEPSESENATDQGAEIIKELQIVGNTPVEEEISKSEIIEENSKLAIPEAEESFVIIGGSFSDIQNALSLKNELIKKGYSSDTHHTNTGYVRVSFNMYSDSLSAVKDIDKIRSTHNPDAWILKLK